MNPDDESTLDQLRKLYAITSSITSTVPSDWGVTGATITASAPAQYMDHTIKGEMLVASASYHPDAIDAVGKDEIKQKLALQLAGELLSGKFIEFTQMKDRFNFDTIVKARVYVVPDNQVKILRTKGF